MLQCAAVCCSVLQRVAACCSVLQCVAVCCSVVRCSAVWCSALQRVCFAPIASGFVLQCVAVCYSVLQCVAVCCTVLQCVAVVSVSHLLHKVPTSLRIATYSNVCHDSFACASQLFHMCVIIYIYKYI